jgi:hypothetical protein
MRNKERFPHTTYSSSDHQHFVRSSSLVPSGPRTDHSIPWYFVQLILPSLITYLSILDIPHVAGSPYLKVLSVSKTFDRPSDYPHFVSLSNPILKGSLPDLPCSQDAHR